MTVPQADTKTVSSEMRSPAPVRLRVDSRDTSASKDRFLALARSATPRLSWIIPLVRTGQRQSAFDVRLLEGTNSTGGPEVILWSSGPVESESTFIVPDTSLAPHSRARFCVRARDENGSWSPWSTAADVETGPLSLSDWGTSWVSHPPLHTLRRSFEISDSVLSGRLHITAQGLVRASVNSTPVNSAASDPSRTDLARALYRSYDVSDLIRQGKNTLDLDCARGEWERTSEQPRLLVALVIDLDDGSRQVVGTGPGMSAAASIVTVEEPFYLERHDAVATRTFLPAEKLVQLAAHVEPESAATPPVRVEVDPAPAIRSVDTLEAVELSSTAARTWDLGVNIAGRSRVVLRSGVPRGTTIRTVHGEHLTDDGHVDTTNLTMPFDHGRVRQSVEYVVAGDDDELLEAWFCFHGFRYVEVLGLPVEAVIHVEAVTLHTDLPAASTLFTDDVKVNALVAAAQRTLLNNVHGIPEDCPTREQSGWTGDTASVTEFEFAAFDMESFFAKWLGDLRTSQQPGGWIPAISPDVRASKTLADPVWGAALQRVLIGHWMNYGDSAVVDECLPSLRAWVDFQLSCRSDDGTIGRSPISYGHDWLGLEQTPPELHHTAATFDSLEVLASLEDAVGNDDEAELRRTQAEELRTAARKAFVDESDTVVGNGSQGSYAVAIEAGWLRGAERDRAAERIEKDLRVRGNRVSSGFATTLTVVMALGHTGRSQAIFDVLHQPNEPGIGAMLDHGNGTFWECWWIDRFNTGTGSLDHIGLGGPFAAWAWRSLAGLRPIEAGYRRFAIEPQFVDGVNSLDLVSQTVLGTIGISYRRDVEGVHLQVTVPVGAEAVVRLPGIPEKRLCPGHHSLRGDAPALEARVGPALETPWSPPSIAPLSSDVRGESDLLQRAIDSLSITVGDEIVLDILQDGVRCMPVPHAQLAGPIVRVSHSDSASSRTGPSASVSFDVPLDLSEASFAYALLDLCLPNPARPMHPQITLRSSDGSVRSSSGRLWPAGWNRVTVDLNGWPGSASIQSINVGLCFDGVSDIEKYSGVDVSETPAAFHWGGLGYSTSRRTWP
jgi:alpha-L-rhamnosidase